MLIILKTVKDRAILSKFWSLWVLQTLHILSLKIINFQILTAILNFDGKWKSFILKPAILKFVESDTV